MIKDNKYFESIKNNYIFFLLNIFTKNYIFYYVKY